MDKVYEWRLYAGMLLGQHIMTIEFFTDFEIEELDLLKGGLFRKIEETKRERTDDSRNCTR